MLHTVNTYTYICSVLILFTVLTGACDEAPVEQGRTLTERNSDLEIRIQNNSPYTMKDVTVFFPTDTIQYGNIPSGEKSDYQGVTKAYRYAYIKMIIDEKELVLQPIDYVGEPLLKPGQYTYQLNLDEKRFNSDNYRYALSLKLLQP